MKDPQISDTKAKPKISSHVSTSEIEKGNPIEILPSVVSESCKKLGLEDLNAGIESTENMDIDDPKTGNENTANDSVQLSLEKVDGQKDVGLDVETSLDQQEKQDDDARTPVEDEFVHEDGSEKDGSEEKKQTREEHTEVKSDLEEDMSVEKNEENVMNVDDIDSDDIPLGKKYGESVAKRLRSNKVKIVPSKTRTPEKTVSDVSKVPSETETPKTRTKNVGVGPKRGWSKVKVKPTVGRTRKMKVVSSSESEYDVKKDVQTIIPSASNKYVGKKVMQTVENVPIDKI